MICPQCKAETPQSEFLCTSCGYGLRSDLNQQQPYQQQSYQRQSSQQPSSQQQSAWQQSARQQPFQQQPFQQQSSQQQPRQQTYQQQSYQQPYQQQTNQQQLYQQQPYQQPSQQPSQQLYQQPYQQPYHQAYQQPYRQPYQQPAYPSPNKQSLPGKSAAIGSLCCGILGLLLALIRGLNVNVLVGSTAAFAMGYIIGSLFFQTILCTVALIIGIRARKQGYSGGKAIAGIVLGSIGLVVIVFRFFMYLSMINSL